MTFIIVFSILYGLGFGVCRLATMLFTGTDATLVKTISYIPIVNVISAILIIFFIFYIVKDYRKNKQIQQQKQKQNATV